MKYIIVFGAKGTIMINAAQVQHCTLCESIITVYFANNGGKLEVEYEDRMAASKGFFEIWNDLKPEES